MKRNQTLPHTKPPCAACAVDFDRRPDRGTVRKIPLFDEHDGYTHEGQMFADRVAKAVGPIILKLRQRGFSRRDIDYIACAQVGMLSHIALVPPTRRKE
jgi:hypothetical protein